MMEIEEKHSRLAALTDTFDSSEELEHARALLAQNIEHHIPSAFATRLQEAGLVMNRDWASYFGPARKAEVAGSKQASSAVRRDQPFRVPINLGVRGATAQMMRPRRTIGPFRGISGNFWIDLFGSEGAYSIYQAGAAIPTIVLTNARLPVSGMRTYTIEIDGGTIWILAGALNPAFSNDAYVGFTVSGGSLMFKTAPTVAGTKLTFTGDLEATLAAIPTDAAAPAAGLCAAAASAQGPARVDIAWATGAPPKISLGDGSANFFGATIDFRPFESQVRQDSDLGILIFDYEVTPKTWDSSSVKSSIVQFNGVTNILGGWALTLVRPANPDQLSEADGPGFFIIQTLDTIQAKWTGAPTEVDLFRSVISVRDGQIVITSRQGSAKPEMAQLLRLSQLRQDAGAPRLPLTLRFGKQIDFSYLCDAVQGEGLYATCGLDFVMNLPVDVAGRPLTLGHSDTAIFALENQGTGVTVRVVALANALTEKTDLGHRIIALRNGLIGVTEPVEIDLQGPLNSDDTVDSGSLAVTLGTYGWFPTLPDPYVTNQSTTDRQTLWPDVPTGAIVATISWSDPSKATVEFTGVLSSPLGSTVNEAAPNPRPVAQQPDQIRVPTQTDEGRLATGFGAIQLRAVDKRSKASASGNPERDKLIEKEKRQIAALSGIAGEVLPNFGQGVRLLDVSTKKDQLGVEFGANASTGATFTLQTLDICTQASNLVVFALPQVQWEPVRTLDIDQDIPHLGQFPTPLASATDGGATRLGALSVRLVPTIPDVAVDATLAEFGSGNQIGLLTTMPFGLKTMVSLRPTTSGGRAPDTVKRNEPKFTKPALRGGAQLAFLAESGPNKTKVSSYFDGAAVQLLNGVDLDTGSPLHISVLGSVVSPADGVEAMFNNEFAPGGARPSVPITRLDISGYGGSCFSDWIDQDAVFAEASKVQFQVVVGRTSREVVKISTILYPWGIRLTRSVTIERKGGGGVIRRDSGWQPNSPGLFDFPATNPPTPGTPYIIEPGLLRGLFNVRNIRATGAQPISFMGKNGKQVTLAPKFFDADARIDGLEGAATLAADGVLGYLQIEPVGAPLHEDDLKLLIEQQGAIGGPVDGVVQVGHSGFHIRATRIEVGASTTSGHPELVGVVRGAPVFHQNGSWSAVRLPGPANPHGDSDAVNIDQVRGLPIVREGLLLGIVNGTDMIIGPMTDYRFADPEDLHQPTNPQFEYGFIQTSPAHTFMFPRPYIDDGVTEIRTRSQPMFADVYARMTSKGAFPPAANSIVLPSNSLVVNPAAGGFRLRDAVNMPSPRSPLIIAAKGSDVVQIDYSGATLSTSFNQQQWNLDLSGMELWSDLMGIKKFFGWRSRIVAGTSTRPVLRDIDTLFHPDFEAVLSILRASRPTLGPIDLAGTNDKTEVKVQVEVDLHADAEVIAVAIGVKGYIGWEWENATPDNKTFFEGVQATLEVEGKIPLTPTPLFIVIGGQVEAGNKFKPPASVTDFEAKIYVGVGIKVPAIEGFIAVGADIQIDDTTVKAGPIVLLKAEFGISSILKIELSGEFKGVFYDSAMCTTKTCDWGGEVEINIEILFIGIHASVEITETSCV